MTVERLRPDNAAKAVKHTAGPWAVHKERPWEVYSANDTLVVEIAEDDDLGCADARLIAASPDLLAFAEHVIDLHPEAWSVLGVKVRVVVARATEGV